MKARTFFAVVLATVCLGTLPLGVTVGVLVGELRAETTTALDEVGPMLDQTLAKLESRAALTVGSTATAMHPEYPRIGAHTIMNDSTTCIACGGSDVTATTGLLVGDGCAVGKYLSLDVATSYCIRVGGSDATGVVVAYGAR